MKGDQLSLIAAECLQDSEEWFGHKGNVVTPVHMALSMAGEVGEVCNIIKKVQRGSLSFLNAREDVLAELADVFIYLMVLIEMFEGDLANEYKLKREYNIERFGQ